MKQQRKKQKIFAKKGIKVEQGPTKIEQNENDKSNTNNMKSGELQHLPTIQNMLEIPKQNRTAKVQQYFKKIKPFLVPYIMKKQGSRVLQLVYKWGNQQIRTTIFETIIKNWKEFIKSKYAIYVISKVAADYQIPNLLKDVIVLQNQREGAIVIQNFIAKHPNSAMTAQIFRKFESISANIDTQKIQSQQIMHNLAMKSIQKGYFNLRVSKLILRLTLSSLFDAQKQKTMQALIENYGFIIDEEQGVKLFIELVNNCDSKQKKLLIKHCKGQIQYLINLSPVSYIALLKLFTEVDDTVSIGKKLFPQLLQILPYIEENRKLYNVLISLMSQRTNNFNCLGKYESQVYTTNCKKLQSIRMQQIRQHLYEPVIQFLLSEESIHQTCTNSNRQKLALGTIKSMQKDQYVQGFQKLSKGLFSYFIDDAKTKINSKADFEKQAAIADTFGSKLLKNIIFAGSKSDTVSVQCQQLTQIFVKNIDKILSSKATFVLSALLETNQKSSQKLLKQMKKSRANFDKILLGKYYKDKMNGKK